VFINHTAVQQRCNSIQLAEGLTRWVVMLFSKLQARDPT
jgi:hypothetical protein